MLPERHTTFQVNLNRQETGYRTKNEDDSKHI